MSGGSSKGTVQPLHAEKGSNEGEARPRDPEREKNSETTLEDSFETEEPRLLGHPVVAAIVGLALIGWTVLFVFARGPASFASADLSTWVSMLSVWSMPALLISFAGFAATQSFGRKAAQFRQTARDAAQDIATLETKLTSANRELSIAREFLAQQTRDLESLGRVAAARLSQNADRLEELIAENGEETERIAQVSERALENMSRLRDDLPVITNASRDAANAIGQAGERAEGQIERLGQGLSRLNEFGEAGERHVSSFRAQVEQTLGHLGDQASEMEALTERRFATLREQCESLRAELDAREVDALAAIRRRAEALSEELAEARAAIDAQEGDAAEAMRDRIAGLRQESEDLSATITRESEDGALRWSERVDAMRDRLEEAVNQVSIIDQQALTAAQSRLDSLREEAERVDTAMRGRDKQFLEWANARRTRLEETERKALEALEARLATLDAALEERNTQHDESAKAISEASAGAAEDLAKASARLAELAKDTETSREALVAATATIREDITSSRNQLNSLDETLSAVTEAGVRLLELIQSGASHSRDELPQAMENAEAKLVALRDGSEKVQRAIDTAAERSENLSAYVLETRESGEALFGFADSLDDRLAASRDGMAEHVAALRAALGSLDEEATAVADNSTKRLSEAVDALESSTEKAQALLAAFAEEEGAELGAKMGERVGSSIDEAVRTSVEEALAELGDATTRSADAARDAARQLRDQLALVNELAGNLENRVSLARERAEEKVDNDFARRVALITESLNSNAIDIAKALSSEVSDNAWEGYLRGDRGIFTRRAVRLLDSTQAREIAELYDEESDFRENVNRYIHDFEAMLRTMLSTRDGNAIAVTLLSSEMGKLYVALAQALERLRTA